MSEERWFAIYRTGNLPQGQWHEHEIPVGSVLEDAEDVVQAIRCEYEDAGVPDSIRRGAFGGFSIVRVFDRWSGATYELTAETQNARPEIHFPDGRSKEKTMKTSLLQVIAEELTERGWRPGTTEAGQVLWTKGPYIAIPETQAVTVELRMEREGADNYAVWP